MSSQVASQSRGQLGQTASHWWARHPITFTPPPPSTIAHSPPLRRTFIHTEENITELHYCHSAPKLRCAASGCLQSRTHFLLLRNTICSFARHVSPEHCDGKLRCAAWLWLPPIPRPASHLETARIICKTFFLIVAREKLQWNVGSTPWTLISCHSASWHQMICTWRKCEILLLFLFARGSFAPSCCTTQLCVKLLSITLHLHLQSTSWRWGPIRGSAEVSPWPAVLGKSWDEALQSEAHKSSL